MKEKYVQFIRELKKNIIQSRYHVARSANRENLRLYFKTGKMLSEKIKAEKWGAKMLDQISNDLQQQLPGLRGLSSGNLKKMRIFAEEYEKSPIGSLLTNQLGTNETIPLEGLMDIFFSVSFTHHFTILSKVKDWQERFFYVRGVAQNFWTVTILEHHLESDLYSKQGTLSNNFSKAMADDLTPRALEVFRDEYLLDFVSIEESDDEREIENKVIIEIRNFILRMGKGFSFIGNQYRVELEGEEFFIDLLFFNRYLQSLVAFELKRGKFKPEYVGKLNFYLNVLDDKIKLPYENPSIGIILCKEKEWDFRFFFSVF